MAASLAPLQAIISTRQYSSATNASPFLGPKISSFQRIEKKKRNSLTLVAAVGDISSAGNIYLAAGAAAVSLIGTAFILFSRKDLCPVCDGEGFVSKGEEATWKEKDYGRYQVQVVCTNCNGQGKLNQVKL